MLNQSLIMSLPLYPLRHIVQSCSASPRLNQKDAQLRQYKWPHGMVTGSRLGTKRSRQIGHVPSIVDDALHSDTNDCVRESERCNKVPRQDLQKALASRDVKRRYDAIIGIRIYIT